MNIFKATGVVLDATVQLAVTLASKSNSIADNALTAVDNVAIMSRDTTQSMLVEMKEEAKQSLAELKSKA